MNYPGDVPPTPEERAALRLAANAGRLARAKKSGHAPGGAYHKYPDFEALDEKLMADDNRKALAAAEKAIAGERKTHKCYICGRRDAPRYARWFGLWAAGFLAVWLYLSDNPRLGNDAPIFGLLGVAAIGAAFGAGIYESIKPEDEQELRKKFNETSHG
jgi:hypothetical protein